VAILFRRFGTTHQSHVKGQEILQEIYCYFFSYLYSFLFPLRQRLKEKVQRVKQVVDERRGPRPVSYFCSSPQSGNRVLHLTTGPLWGSDVRLESEPDTNTNPVCCRQWNSRDVPP